MSDWMELSKILGTAAIASGALAWLVRSIITHWLTKDIEVYKTKLSHESEQQIERLKVDLQIAAKEQETRFSKLHEKRADIIAELYYLLRMADVKVSLFQRLLSLRQSGSDVDEKLVRHAEQAKEAANSLFLFVEKHQLYFSEELASKLTDFSTRVFEPTFEYTVLHIRHKQQPSEAIEAYAGIVAKWTEQEALLRAATRSIEEEFRAILGSAPVAPLVRQTT